MFVIHIQSVAQALRSKHYTVSLFTSGKDAGDYLEKSIRSRVIGFGDSATIRSMNLYERLSPHNTVYDLTRGKDHDELLEIAKKSLTTEIFFTSVNAMAETGELVNIDGTGNRIAGSLFGHQKVYFIVSTNKIEPTLEKAIWRARNVAAPKNARRFHLDTPCAKEADRCYDCSGPERGCCALTIYLRKMYDIEAEIVLIDEELGF